MDAVPSALAHSPVSHDVLNKHPTRQEVLFGLLNGNVGQLFFDSSSHHFGVRQQAEAGCAAVVHVLSAFDMTQSGMDDIAVAREDGSFEVYNVSVNGELQLVRTHTIAMWLAQTPQCLVCALAHEDASAA